MVFLNPDSGRRDGIRKRQKIKNVDQYGKRASRLVEKDPFSESEYSTQCLALFSCTKVGCCPRIWSALCTYEPGLKTNQSKYLTCGGVNDIFIVADQLQLGMTDVHCDLHLHIY